MINCANFTGQKNVIKRPLYGKSAMIFQNASIIETDCIRMKQNFKNNKIMLNDDANKIIDDILKNALKIKQILTLNK